MCVLIEKAWTINTGPVDKSTLWNQSLNRSTHYFTSISVASLCSSASRLLKRVGALRPEIAAANSRLTRRCSRAIRSPPWPKFCPLWSNHWKFKMRAGSSALQMSWWGAGSHGASHRREMGLEAALAGQPPAASSPLARGGGGGGFGGRPRGNILLLLCQSAQSIRGPSWFESQPAWTFTATHICPPGYTLTLLRIGNHQHPNLCCFSQGLVHSAVNVSVAWSHHQELREGITPSRSCSCALLFWLSDQGRRYSVDSRPFQIYIYLLWKCMSLFHTFFWILCVV